MPKNETDARLLALSAAPLRDDDSELEDRHIDAERDPAVQQAMRNVANARLRVNAQLVGKPFKIQFNQNVSPGATVWSYILEPKPINFNFLINFAFAGKNGRTIVSGAPGFQPRRDLEIGDFTEDAVIEAFIDFIKSSQ